MLMYAQVSRETAPARWWFSQGEAPSLSTLAGCANPSISLNAGNLAMSFVFVFSPFNMILFIHRL